MGFSFQLLFFTFDDRCQFKVFHKPYFAWKGSYVVCRVRIWNQCYYFIYIFALKFGKKDQSKLVYLHTYTLPIYANNILVFKKNANMFAENSDHNMDPCTLEHNNGVTSSSLIRSVHDAVIWGPFLTSPPGAKLSPRREFCPLGVKLSPGGEILCSPLHSS
jgi:hypothetical protein